jgi:S1-C subfamily serine protease
MKSPTRLILAAGFLALGIAIGAFFTGSRSQGQNPALAAIPRELTSYRDVVKHVLPCVVNIEAKAKPRNRPGQPADDGDLGFGTGFIVDSSGTIMTNYHVVEGADHLVVQMIDGPNSAPTISSPTRRLTWR